MKEEKLFIVVYHFFFIVILLCSCGKVGLMDAGEGIPYPRTPSIIPLAVNSQWVYSHTAHDSSGSVTANLRCEIGRVYGLDFDTLLTLITGYNVEQKFQLYLYEYEWEELDSGVLISYRDRNVDTTGIYIHGEYFGEYKTLYTKPILWLRYPAAIGDTWYQASPDSTDTLLPLYEVIDTSITFTIPAQVENALSPVAFIQCYLYKRIKADTISYYYYSPQYGLVGFLEYINGVLRRTFILKGYRVS